MSRCFPGPFAGPFAGRGPIDPTRQNPSRNRRNGLKRMIGNFVCINLVGDEKVEGRLIAVCRDYIVLRTRDGIVYVNANQVESVAENGANRSRGSRTPRFIRAANFHDLVRQLENEFVKITFGRNDKVKGYITDVCDNTATVVDCHKLVSVYIDKIKTIRPLNDRDRLGSGSNGNRSNPANIVPAEIAPVAAGNAGRSGRSRGETIGSNNELEWALGTIPEPEFRPNRYGVPESLLLNGAKKKPSARKLKKK
ncbi:DUF2642 domain-containing protein [Paenibacillus protaetiae]|nr:DUF2642 domain-containing protein [Paenibacillus protaetiae]